MPRNVVSCLAFAALCAAGVTHAGLRSGGSTGTDLPAAPETLFRGGQTLTLRGLGASESLATDVTFVNLAQTGNRCTLALADGNGFGLGPAVSLTLKAREKRPFLDVFERLVDADGVGDARATISCSHDFSAHALVTDRARGRVDLAAPEALDGDSLLQALPVPVAACPPGASCFDSPGIVHIPDPPPGPEMPVGRVAFPAPAGAVKRLRLSLNVTVGDWFPEQPSGKHLIYWFVVNKNIDMPGLLYFRGPGKSQAFARHGVGLTHPQKIKVIKPFTAQKGRTYHVDNDYDMARRTYTVTVTDLATGDVKATLRSRPNLGSYNIKAGSKFLVDMGFYPGLVETEVPSYGWKYADIHVEAYMQ